MIPLPRPIYQQIAMQLYIFGSSGGVAEEHAYRLTMAMVPFGCAHDGLSGFWFILRDNLFPGTGGAGLRGVAEGVVRAVGRWAGGRAVGGWCEIGRAHV